MSHSACKIYESSFSQNVERFSVRKCISYYIVAAFFLLNRHFSETGNIYLTVEVSCVAEYRIVLHYVKMLFDDNVPAACYGNKYISVFCRFIHRHYAETVHRGIKRLERIYLCYNDICAHALGSHCGTFSAPSVSRNYNSLSCYDKVCSIHYCGPYRLSCTVFIVIIMLCFCIIYSHHGTRKDSFPFSRLKPVDSGCSLLTTSYQPVCITAAASSEQVYKVSSVIYDKIGMACESLCKQIFIFFFGNSVDSKGLNTHLCNCRCHIILSRKRIAACKEYVCAAFFKHESEISRLSLKMNGNRYLKSLKRLLLFKLLFYLSECRHK